MKRRKGNEKRGWVQRVGAGEGVGAIREGTRISGGEAGCGWWRVRAGAVSIIVINTITINAAETSSVRSSSELGFLLLHFYRGQAFPANGNERKPPRPSNILSDFRTRVPRQISLFLFLYLYLLLSFSFSSRDCRNGKLVFLPGTITLYVSLCRSPWLQTVEYARVGDFRRFGGSFFLLDLRIYMVRRCYVSTRRDAGKFLIIRE